VKDLYNVNYKPLQKEIEKDIRRWEYLSWISIINIMKVATLPKKIYMSNAILTKIPMTFLTDIEKSTINFIWKHKRLQIAKIIRNKKSNTGGITIPDFKLYNRTIVIKTVWY
jgi:hypothetical protein